MKVNMRAAFRLYLRKEDGYLKQIEKYKTGYVLRPGKIIFRLDGMSTEFSVRKFDDSLSHTECQGFEQNSIWVVNTGYEHPVYDKNSDKMKYLDSFDISDSELSRIHMMRKQIIAKFLASTDMIKKFEIFACYPKVNKKEEVRIPTVVELIRLNFEYRKGLHERKIYDVDREVLKDFNINVSKINNL